MKKVSVIILVFLSIFILSCGDEAASDNDGGITDNETVNDDENTVDEEAKDGEDIQDEVNTADESETKDDVDEEVKDEEDTDEVADEVSDDSENPDDSNGPSDEALTCCQEIVKEWFRCEGSFDFDAVQGCVDCVKALTTCEEFNPLDTENFSCKTECGAVCPTVAFKGDGSGTDRRLIADEYCRFIMDSECDLRSTDFSALGAIEGLDACYDM